MPGPAFGLFEINPDTGEMVTMVTFDREAQGVFTLRGKGLSISFFFYLFENVHV